MIYMYLWMNYDIKLPLRWQISNRFEVEYFKACLLTTKKLRALVDERKERSEYLKPFARISNVSDKETYRTVNMIMKPLLKKHGYRSLAQLEHALESCADDMP
jgi:hypothetical protein